MERLKELAEEFNKLEDGAQVFILGAMACFTFLVLMVCLVQPAVAICAFLLGGLYWGKNQ